jgi:hypothetical protein
MWVYFDHESLLSGKSSECHPAYQAAATCLVDPNPKSADVADAVAASSPRRNVVPNIENGVKKEGWREEREEELGIQLAMHLLDFIDHFAYLLLRSEET